MKFKIVIIFSLLGLLINSLHSYAGPTFGTVRNATIIKIRVDFTGKAMITFSKPITEGTPECVNPYYASVLAIDASTEGGKAVLSMAMLAKVNQTPVTAHGLGRCTVYGSAEDWNHGFLL